MGEPILQGVRHPDDPPRRPAGRRAARRSTATSLTVTAVSMGNPHAVVYVDDVASFPVETRRPAARAPPGLPAAGQRPLRQVHRPGRGPDADLGARRGITLACGTGACAVCVAGVLTGRTGRDAPRPPARRRPRARMAGRRRLGLHDRPGHRGLHRRVAGVSR